MNTQKKFAALVTFLAATASGLSIGMPFFITYDFDAGASATVTDPAGAFASVGDFTGGALDGNSMNANLTSATPAIFSFNFSLNSPYTASILAMGYHATFTGPTGAITGAFLDSNLLGGAVALPSVNTSAAFFTSINGITSGTISFQAVGVQGLIELADFQVYGSVEKGAVAPPPAKVPDSNTSVLGMFALVGLIAFSKRLRK